MNKDQEGEVKKNRQFNECTFEEAENSAYGVAILLCCSFKPILFVILYYTKTLN